MLDNEELNGHLGRWSTPTSGWQSGVVDESNDAMKRWISMPMEGRSGVQIEWV